MVHEETKNWIVFTAPVFPRLGQLRGVVNFYSNSRNWQFCSSCVRGLTHSWYKTLKTCCSDIVKEIVCRFLQMCCMASRGGYIYNHKNFGSTTLPFNPICRSDMSNWAYTFWLKLLSISIIFVGCKKRKNAFPWSVTDPSRIGNAVRNSPFYYAIVLSTSRHCLSSSKLFLRKKSGRELNNARNLWTVNVRVPLSSLVEGGE